MASVNKVIIVGNLGRDPETRYMPNGDAITNVSIATTLKWKSKDSGEQVEETEWHRVVFKGRLAEIAGEYLKKGRSVYVEGRLKTRKWTDKDGQERFTTEIVATEMQMLGGREGMGGPSEEGGGSYESSGGSRGGYSGGGGSNGNNARSPAPAPAAAARQPAKSGTAFDDMEDDIPF